MAALWVSALCRLRAWQHILLWIWGVAAPSPVTSGSLLGSVLLLRLLRQWRVLAWVGGFVSRARKHTIALVQACLQVERWRVPAAATASGQTVLSVFRQSVLCGVARSSWAVGFDGVLLHAADVRKPLNSGHVDRGIASVGQPSTCTVCSACAAVLLEGSKIVCEGSKACPACERFRGMHERTGRRQRLFLCPAQILLLLVCVCRNLPLAP